MRRAWLFMAALSVSPAHAQRMMVLGAGGPLSSASSFVGPGDVVSGATAWYGLRGYSAAYAATGTGKSVNIRRASNNDTQDIFILTTGAFDIASYNTFVGTDTTGSCTIASTTLTCTGLGSTLHINDPISGAGIGQPCYLTAVGAFSLGAQTATINAASICGAVGVAVTVTAQVAGFVTKAYDQSGNSNDILNATAAQQPQLLPNAINGLPGINFISAAFQALTTAAASVSVSGTANTFAAVAARRANFTTRQILMGWDGSTALGIGWPASADLGMIFSQSGASTVSQAMTDSVVHSLIGVQTGAATAIAVVDGTASSPGTISGGAVSTKVSWGCQVTYGVFSTALSGESGLWSGTTFTPTQYGNVRANQSSYWGTP